MEYTKNVNVICNMVKRRPGWASLHYNNQTLYKY